MCGKLIMVEREVVEQIIYENAIKTFENPLPDWPARRIDAYPQSRLPIIVEESGSLAIAEMQWGYPLSWKKGVAFNTRAETALGSPDNMWRESLEKRRCLVPTYGFYEPHRTQTAKSPKTGKQIKRQYLFTVSGEPLFYLAGIFEEDHFSVMTTKPNASMEPIHDRMPVALKQKEAATWLQGDFAALLDRDGIDLESTAL